MAIISVSYTHLDVYKRQPVLEDRVCPRNHGDCLFLRPVIDIAVHPLQVTVQTDAEHPVAAVSYTHLEKSVNLEEAPMVERLVRSKSLIT